MFGATTFDMTRIAPVNLSAPEGLRAEVMPGDLFAVSDGDLSPPSLYSKLLSPLAARAWH